MNQVQAYSGTAERQHGTAKLRPGQIVSSDGLRPTPSAASPTSALEHPHHRTGKKLTICSVTRRLPTICRGTRVLMRQRLGSGLILASR